MYQSLNWVDALRRVMLRTPDPVMKAKYRTLLKDWWDTNRSDVNPTTGRSVRGDYRWSDMATAYRGLVYVCAIPELSA